MSSPRENEAPPFPLSESECVTIHDIVLEWYERAGRSLPWRETTDPYRILVAEVMLQQTQVSRVEPKYRRFIERFGSFHALAAAPRSAVIAAWSGLGYNRRAVNLHRSAQLVVERHNGVLPVQKSELLTLPGIGEYTARAVRAFAFDAGTVALDTNIRRTLARVVYGHNAEWLDDVFGRGTALFTLAERLLTTGHGRDWNNAMMDIGATICIAGRPICDRCPLPRYCAWYAAHSLLASTAADDKEVVATRRQQMVVPRYDKGQAASGTPQRTVEPFVGSDRFYRGRVVKRLLASDEETVAAIELGALIEIELKSDADATRYRELIQGLQRDGLVALFYHKPNLDGEHDPDAPWDWLERTSVSLPR